MKINWRRKLSSRKFWSAVVGFVATILIAFNVPDLTIEQVTAIIGAIGALVAYIITEGYIDGQNINSEVKGNVE